MFGYGPYREVKNNIANTACPIIYNPNNLPVIFCCDLNAKDKPSYKFDKSLNKMVKFYGCEAYEFVTGKKRELPSDSKEDENDCKTKELNINEKDGLGFVSMMKLALGGKNEPIFTTWKERRNEDEKDEKAAKMDGEVSKHTIAYIFKQDMDNVLKITHYLDIPDIDETNNSYHGKALLPDWHYGSDHFSLAMRFEWN